MGGMLSCSVEVIRVVPEAFMSFSMYTESRAHTEGIPTDRAVGAKGGISQSSSSLMKYRMFDLPLVCVTNQTLFH